MPIRAKNLDLNTELMRQSAQALLGDVTATLTRVVFVAPYACEVKAIDVLSTSGVSANSSATVVLTAHLTAASDTMAARSANTSGANSDNIVANIAYRLTPSANNSLSTGQVVKLLATLDSAVLSGVMVSVQYVPLVHKESR